jgi:hypothetical protein
MDSHQMTVSFHIFLWSLLLGELFLFTRKDNAVMWRLRIGIAIMLLVGAIEYSYLMEMPPEPPAQFFLSLSVFTEGVFRV